MIKLIIFDIGGILAENYDNAMFKALAKACKKERNVIEEECKNFMYQSEKGLITEYEFIKQFLKKMHCNEDPQKIVDKRRAATKEIKGVREFIQQLRKYCKVAFATNCAQEEIAYNIKKLSFKELFDYGVASCQIGERKTGKKMFENILSHFNVSAKEAVFIDDSKANLTSPQELGMNTIHFTSLEQCKKELENKHNSYI